MKAPGANLLEVKRQGGWERWEMVERYSHAIPPRDRLALPNPLGVGRTKLPVVSSPSRGSAAFSGRP